VIPNACFLFFNFIFPDIRGICRDIAFTSAPSASPLLSIRNEGKIGVGAWVVVQFFDDKFGRDVAHLHGEQHFTPKSLTYKDQSTFI
jgi:hypothetical protein